MGLEGARVENRRLVRKVRTSLSTFREDMGSVVCIDLRLLTVGLRIRSRFAADDFFLVC